MDVRAGVVGGTIRSTATTSLASIEDTPGVIEVGAEGSRYRYAGPVEELVLPLDDPGEDVLVEIFNPCAEGAGSWFSGAWVDALRFE